MREFYVYDKYADGDKFDDETYISNFQSALDTFIMKVSVGELYAVIMAKKEG